MAKEMEFNMSAAVVLNLVPLSFWSHHNCQAGDQLPHIKFHANQTTDCRFRCKSDLSKLVKLVNIQTAELRRFPFFQISNMASIRIVIEVIFQNLVIFRTQFSICTQSLVEKKPFFGRDMVKMISNMAAAAFLNLLPVFGRLTSASAQSNFIQIRQ